MKKLLIVLALACTLSSLYAQKTCYSELKGDTLVIGMSVLNENSFGMTVILSLIV